MDVVGYRGKSGYHEILQPRIGGSHLTVTNSNGWPARADPHPRSLAAVRDRSDRPPEDFSRPTPNPTAMTGRELSRRTVLGGMVAAGAGGSVVVGAGGDDPASTSDDHPGDGGDADGASVDSGEAETESDGAETENDDGPERADAENEANFVHEALCTCPVCMGGAAPGGF